MPRWPMQLGDSLPDLAVDMFREACYTFSNGVGLGWDKLHPRAIARCSDVVICALLQFFASQDVRRLLALVSCLVLLISLNISALPRVD